MLATIFTYLIWKDLREQNEDPDSREFMEEKVRNALILFFLWPVILINLAQQLEEERHKKIWVISVLSFTILSSALGGIGLYLLIGITLGAIKLIGYLTIAYRLQLKKEKETESK